MRHKEFYEYGLLPGVHYVTVPTANDVPAMVESQITGSKEACRGFSSQIIAHASPSQCWHAWDAG